MSDPSAEREIEVLFSIVNGLSDPLSIDLARALKYMIRERDNAVQRLDTINKLLTEGYYADQLANMGDFAMYDAQAVNQAHRIAARGELPKPTKTP